MIPKMDGDVLFYFTYAPEGDPNAVATEEEWTNDPLIKAANTRARLASLGRRIRDLGGRTGKFDEKLGAVAEALDRLQDVIEGQSAPDGDIRSTVYTLFGETPGGPNVIRGRIVNGVFEASTPRLQLRQIWYLGLGLRGQDLRGPRNTWDLRRVRLRLAFQPDGSLKGLIGAYQPLRDAMSVLSMGGAGTALTADFDCPVIYASMKKMADGDRDPKTGQCTTISTTYELVAVPAFVVPLREDTKKLQARRG